VSCLFFISILVEDIFWQSRWMWPFNYVSSTPICLTRCYVVGELWAKSEGSLAPVVLFFLILNETLLRCWVEANRSLFVWFWRLWIVKMLFSLLSNLTLMGKFNVLLLVKLFGRILHSDGRLHRAWRVDCVKRQLPFYMELKQCVFFRVSNVIDNNWHATCLCVSVFLLVSLFNVSDLCNRINALLLYKATYNGPFFAVVLVICNGT